MKGVASINKSILASKPDLASLKTKVFNLDIDKLKTVATDLRKASNVVDNGNDVVQRTIYDELVTNTNAIDNKVPTTRGLVSKRQYDSEKQPSKHLLVLKTSLQNVFSITIFCLPRRLEEVLQIHLEDV